MTKVNAKKNPGSPMHKVTAQTKSQVRIAAGLGYDQETICRIIRIGSKRTLHKHYKDELKTTKDEMDIAVAGSAYARAIDPDPKNNAMRMFWLKTRCGWREPKDTDAVEMMRSVLEMMQPLSVAEWQKQHPQRKANGHANGSNGQG